MRILTNHLSKVAKLVLWLHCLKSTHWGRAELVNCENGKGGEGMLSNFGWEWMFKGGFLHAEATCSGYDMSDRSPLGQA